jgi:alkylation response protein AidB-like acyl-CoA dehydrogenase
MEKIFFFIQWCLMFIPCGLLVGYFNRKYPQAIDMLNQGTSYYNAEFTGITQGNCYQAIGDYAKAEKQM